MPQLLGEDSSDVITRASAAAISPGGLLSGHQLSSKTKTSFASAQGSGASVPAKDAKPLTKGSFLLSQVPSLGGSVNELLELSAPADLPRDMRPPWLPVDGWDRIKDLGKLIPYNKILNPLFATEAAATQMAKLYEDLLELEVHKVELPQKLKDLTPFQLLLFIRCFQPRAFISAARAALNIHLGPTFSHSEPLDMSSAFLVSDCSTPIVLISSIDQPLPQLMHFAEMRCARVAHMAMGRGQVRATNPTRTTLLFASPSC
jgi:dynein heavy chain